MPKPPTHIEVAQDVRSVAGGEVTGLKVGQITGVVHVAAQTLQIGGPHGAVVNIDLTRSPALPRPRPRPLDGRPRRPPAPLDRLTEIDTAVADLQQALAVEFYGSAGLGKTRLLRHLSYHPVATSFGDGVVCVSADQPLEDLLQSLFDELYERDPDDKPSDGQLRQALHGARLLVVLDDVDLPRESVEELMNALPSSALLLASPDRHLWGEGSPVALRGLPEAESLALLEQGLGRALAPDEQTAAHTLWQLVAGSPLQLLRAAALVRDDATPLRAVVGRLQGSASVPALANLALAPLGADHVAVLAALAALQGASLGTSHLAALAGVPEVRPVLETLEARALVQSYSPRYSLAGGLESHLRSIWDLTGWSSRALVYFIQWAEQAPAPSGLLEETSALLRILDWAAGARRWPEVLRLARAVEQLLALGGRWGMWARVLHSALEAARNLGDEAALAWCLHQLGARAIGLENVDTARGYLQEALRIREALADTAGAEVTRHNLDLLRAVPPPAAGPTPAESGVAARIISVLLRAILVVAVVAAATRATLELVPHATITLGNGSGCSPLPPPPASALTTALTGIRLFDTIPPGGTGELSLPAPFLRGATVLREGRQLSVSVAGLPQVFTLPTEVTAIRWGGLPLVDGEPQSAQDGLRVDVDCAR